MSDQQSNLMLGYLREIREVKNALVDGIHSVRMLMAEEEHLFQSEHSQEICGLLDYLDDTVNWISVLTISMERRIEEFFLPCAAWNDEDENDENN